MKLVALVFATLLAAPLAHAEEAPPGAAAPRNRELRRALMQHFDRDGDGRLSPRERMHAARVLGRIQQKLAGQHARRSPEERQRRRELRQQRRMQRDVQVDIDVR